MTPVVALRKIERTTPNGASDIPHILPQTVRADIEAPTAGATESPGDLLAGDDPGIYFFFLPFLPLAGAATTMEFFAPL